MAVGGAQILITNNGAHPPRKWAEIIASEVIVVADDAASELQIAGAALREKIMEVVEPHFAEAHDAEEHSHHETEMHSDPHVSQMIDAIIDAAQGTPWEAHFAKVEVIDLILQRCHLHVKSVMDIVIAHKKLKAEAATSNERA